MTRLALFDVDGTLVNSRAMILAALREAFASEAVALPPERELMGVVGLSLAEVMRRLAPQVDHAAHLRMADAYKTAFWAFRASGEHAEELFAGAKACLEGLRQRGDVKLGIATGKSRRGVAHLLQSQGMAEWFDTVQTADDHPSKPHPAMIAAALAETGADPSATAMIGDTSFDMNMARAAGVFGIAVTWGNHGPTELASAHVLVDDFDALARELTRFWSRADAA